MKKFEKVLKKTVISSWFLAGIPAILFTVFIHPVVSKYTLSVEPARKFLGQYAYSDINNDSISEIFFTGKGIPYYFIMGYDNDMHVFDQWNLSDSLNPLISDFFFGNYDHDRLKEIYIFTHKHDSLFLNVNEFLDPNGLKLERIFITKIGFLKGYLTALLLPAGFFDKNGDGKDELFFVINSHYKSGPRRVYSFDLVNKSLESSQITGSITNDPQMVDVDGDNRPEIFGTMSASGNYTKIMPYSDSSTWLMVFNDQLKFKFQPVEFPGYVNGLYINAIKTIDTMGYVATHIVGGTDSTIMKSRIMIYSTDGKLIRNRLLSEIGFFKSVFTLMIKNDSSDKILLIDDKITELNFNLKVLKSVTLPFHSVVNPYKADIDRDKKDELLIYSIEEGRVIVYNEELQRIGEQKIQTPDVYWKFSHYYSEDHKHRLFMTSGNTGYFFDLKKNRYYYLGYSYYPGIYFLFLLFILLVRKITTWQIEQNESLKRRLVALQLQSIKGQLDPHFTFNTLNSVASLIYTEEREAAYDYMNKFTLLLRGMLNDAERIYRSIDEEIQFVSTYLDLEKLRFGDKFDFYIEIGEGVSRKEQVPKLVLQTFAENSIKHGIMPCENGCVLKILVKRENDNLKLTIEDNGIGRERAAGRSTSTGKGLKLTGEFYDILNQINKRPILHTITDLYDDSGNAAGTRVEVWVPVELIL